MTTEPEIQQWRKDLHASVPIIGRMKRRKAIEALEARREEPAIVPLLVEALEHTDPEVAPRARKALRELKTPQARDALCALAMGNPSGAAARLCVESGHRPSEPERDALFLVVTRQVALYFQEKEYGRDEFQTLRMAYDRADAAIKSQVLEVVRSGDRRWLPFLVRPRKALSECNENEIRMALDSCLKHRDWGRLFNACLELPLKYSFPLLERFQSSGWEPESPELKSLYHQMLADSAGQTVEPPTPPKATSSVFEKWLAQGRQPELVQLTEAQLLEKLKTVDPPEGVSVVAALAGKAGVSSAAAGLVAKSEHWLIRLAGLATGLTKDIVKDIAEDPNYWVRELAGAAGVLEFWPGKATPKDLERLANAPPEAFAGKLGAARKVLRTVIGHRVTTGVFEEMVVEAGVDGAEFVQA
jgi:hypothetical protein